MNRSPKHSNRQTPDPVSPAPSGVQSLAGKSADYYFLTGASGLVGRFLTRDILLSGKKLAVLARPNKRFSAHDRVESLLRRWEAKLGRLLPRPIVLEGDVTQSDLGLSANDRQWVARHCKGVIHNAAVVRFEPAERNQEPWRTNLDGTKNVVDFARRAELQNLHYVSTAYVCGSRSGTILESDLDSGQSFKNTYEESKFHAEQLIAAADGFACKTIYRPSIIAGDSTTGYTSSYHGLMWYLRFLATLMPMQPRDEQGRIHTDIDLPISGDEPHNVITVDWVSAAITRLLDIPEAAGQTVHLVADAPTTFREVIQWCYEYFNSTGVRFVGRECERRVTSDFAEAFLDSSRVYHEYDAFTVAFDNSNFRRLLPDFPCPAITRERVIRYLEFGKHDCWGKRRDELPLEIRDAKVVAQKLATVINEAVNLKRKSLKSHPIIGIDLYGPAGGQWHFQTAPKTPGSVEPGLRDDVQHVFKLATTQLVDTLDGTKVILQGDNVDFNEYIHHELFGNHRPVECNGNGHAISIKKLTDPNRTNVGKDDIPAFQSFDPRLGIEFPAK